MTNFEKVREFHKKFGLPHPQVPLFPHSEATVLRVRLMMEELTELIEAMQMGSKEEIGKELADLLYVVYGTAVAIGLNADHVFDKVHESNMTKSNVRDSGGKIVKGPDYKPVDMETLLDAKPID